MEDFKIDYQNYDRVFKSSFSIFKDEILNFLGLDLPEIESFLETDFAEIETKEEIIDLNFKLKDGSILHLEEEADISENDLIRFASYDLKLYNRYRNNIRTVILCVNGFNGSQAKFDIGTLNYGVIVIDMSNKDGEKKLAEVKEKIEKGESVNILDLIFLPLMKSSKEMETRVKNIIELEQKLDINRELSSKIIAMTLVLTDKFLSKKEIYEIWRDYKMLKIFKIAEEEGIKKGIKKGREEGKEEGKKETMREMVIKFLINKFKKVPDNYKKQIKELDIEELEVIADKIVDMKDLSELEDYLN